MKKPADKYGSMGMSSGRGGNDDIRRGSLGKRTFSSFKNPVYRLYYGGLLGQQFPMNMRMMAHSLLVYRLTGSATILGAMALANAIPMLLLSLFGGVIADRMQKKYVIIAGQLASAVVSLGIALALTMGYLSVERAGSWWILVAASIFQGSILGLTMPSRQAIMREIVSVEQLMNAVSLTIMGMNILRLFAPLLTGFLIDTFDFKAVYFVMTASYLVSVVFIALMPPTSKITTHRNNALTDIKEGLKYLRRAPTILMVLGFTLFAILLSMPYFLMMPIFADDILKVGATGMGWLLSVAGIGAIIASTTLASLPNKRRGVMLLISGVILGLALVGFSFSNSLVLSLAFMVVVGLGQTGRMTLGNTLVQYYVEDKYRGRVMSIYLMQFGLSSFGSFAVGILAESMGVQWAVGGFAMALVVVAILVFVFVPHLRKLD